MIIFIIGPRAFGKTTVGRMLAKELGYEFIDVDKLFIKWVISAYGSVKEFFDRKEKNKGDNLLEWFTNFYKKIHKTLDNLNPGRDYVIVLGGSALVVSEYKLKKHHISNVIKDMLEENKKKVDNLSDFKILIQPSKSINECVTIGWKREQERFEETAKYDEYKDHIKSTINEYRKIADLVVTADGSKKVFQKLLSKLKEFIK